MSFSIAAWQNQVQEALKDWKRQADAGLRRPVYASVSAAILWVLVEAERAGEEEAYRPLLGVAGRMGTNLLVQEIKSWKDLREAACRIDRGLSVQDNERFRIAIDSIIFRMDGLQLAAQALDEGERDWFAKQVREELAGLGGWKRFEPYLPASSPIPQAKPARLADTAPVRVSPSAEGVSLLPAWLAEEEYPDVLDEQAGEGEKLSTGVRDAAVAVVLPAIFLALLWESNRDALLLITIAVALAGFFATAYFAYALYKASKRWRSVDKALLWISLLVWGSAAGITYYGFQFSPAAIGAEEGLFPILLVASQAFGVFALYIAIDASLVFLLGLGSGLGRVRKGKAPDEFQLQLWDLGSIGFYVISISLFVGLIFVSGLFFRLLPVF